MKNATFYLLDNENTVEGLSAVEQLVCDIAAERWRNGKRVLIACEDGQQAILSRRGAVVAAAGELCAA